MPSGKDKLEAAVTLGRRGGMARAKNLTKAQRKEAASKAAKARWKKKLSSTEPSPDFQATDSAATEASGQVAPARKTKTQPRSGS